MFRMKSRQSSDVADVLGRLPYRLALAGGWIDQPFVSRHNPAPPGAMVVVCVEPQFWFMERAGICIGTRNIAMKLWHGVLPPGDPEQLVQQLYEAENRGKAEPSGSQDMIGLIYPGINRLDYDFAHRGGVFPRHIESNHDPQIAAWLSRVVHILAINQRPEGYHPLETKNLDPDWIARLGQSGKDCYEAIVARDTGALGESLNECMRCWEAILPGTVRHRTIQIDLPGLLRYYQSRYPGAMYSGCGGGYLYVVSEDPVPGAFHVQVRTKRS
jgi:hypothetical protein